MRIKNYTLQTESNLLFIDNMQTYNPNDLALWLKSKRKEARLTMDELAEKSGVSKQYISLLERAAPQTLTDKATRPSEKKLLALVQVLDKSAANDALTLAGYAVNEQRVSSIAERTARLIDELDEGSQRLAYALIETLKKQITSTNSHEHKTPQKQQREIEINELHQHEAVTNRKKGRQTA